ncbi:YfiR/HmsC family protein [Thalassotalea sp. G2M2-11]|uniref:YfiR/HmsC family protein n=1 Tax=Thalassotalea sp. G2M2-11 TaxID=2787627 RepID=UPI0019D0E6BE
MALAQELSSEQIKTAYLFNFFKHISWPNEQAKKSYQLAVYKDERIFQSFYLGLNNRIVKGKSINVQLVDQLEDAKQADMVFVAITPEIDISLIASELRKTATLLVTDNSVDKRNIMINLLFNPKTAGIDFEINKSNIVFEQLTMSSEILFLGGTEIDVAELYRETEVAMQEMRQRETELQKTLAEQNEQLAASSERLRKLNKELIQRQALNEDHQAQLMALKSNIELQQEAIDSKEQQLISLGDKLAAIQRDLEQRQQLADQKEQENQTMAKRIEKNRSILAQQQSQIDSQGVQLNQKNEELAERKARIEQQKLYLIVMAVLIIIALIVSTLVVWLFMKNQKTTKQLSQTLTNLKEMQDQLIQSEKLASLGKLTAGVAHEINTPLGIAITSSSSAHESTLRVKDSFTRGTLKKSEVTRYFDDIEQASSLSMSSLNRVIELLNNFKQVAADQVVGEIREVDLTEYINEIMQTLSAELKRHRVNYIYLGGTDIMAKTIPGAIAQVITNLVTNSLKHGFENRDDGNISIDIEQNFNDITIEYKDDGNGMTAEVLQNIFEPFYTTKRNSGGTGLGMNIVYNIVQQKLHGDIKVTSAPQQGAHFNITIPQVLTLN